jgi:DNA-binding CsgD family transcriptional regulator
MTVLDTTTPIRVHVASNNALEKETVSYVLHEAGFLTDFGADEMPDVIVFVAEAPVSAISGGGPVGPDSARSVLVAGIPADDERIADLVLDGIDAVVSFDANPQELADTIRIVGNGGSLLHPRPARRLVELARANRAGSSLLQTPLTKREVDILQCIGRGESVKETAMSLGISAKTVENLQSRLFRKLDVRNRAQAFARAHSLGLLPQDRS